MWDHSAACVLVWGCAGDGRVLAVPAAGAGDMDNYSVSLSAGPSMQVLTTAPLVYPDGFYHGGLCAHSETSTTEAQHIQSRGAAGAGRTRTRKRATYLDLIPALTLRTVCLQSSHPLRTEVMGGCFHSSFG